MRGAQRRGNPSVAASFDSLDSCTSYAHLTLISFLPAFEVAIRNPDEYRPVVKALGPLLHGLPGMIVAIDGLPGVGKTEMGRYLAYRFNVSLIETDLFLIEQQGRLIYHNNQIGRIIAKRGDAHSPCPVIIEGAAVLRLLAELERHPDFMIYITNKEAPASQGSLLADLEAYEVQFSPRQRANLTIALDHFDTTGRAQT